MVFSFATFITMTVPAIYFMYGTSFVPVSSCLFWFMTVASKKHNDSLLFRSKDSPILSPGSRQRRTSSIEQRTGMGCMSAAK